MLKFDWLIIGFLFAVEPLFSLNISLPLGSIKHALERACYFGYQWALNKFNSYQVMLLLTAVTFPHCLFDADSCKCIGIYSLQKLDFKTQWYTEFLTLRPLVLPLFHLGATAQGLQVIISVDSCVLKSNYYLKT